MAGSRSMVDVAYDIMEKKKRSTTFAKLWQDVSKIMGVSDDYVAQFYTDLTLDSRFVSLKDNKWDLKERRKFEEFHVEISDLELDDDESEEGEPEEVTSPISNSDEY